MRRHNFSHLASPPLPLFTSLPRVLFPSPTTTTTTSLLTLTLLTRAVESTPTLVRHTSYCCSAFATPLLLVLLLLLLLTPKTQLCRCSVAQSPAISIAVDTVFSSSINYTALHSSVSLVLRTVSLSLDSINPTPLCPPLPPARCTAACARMVCGAAAMDGWCPHLLPPLPPQRFPASKAGGHGRYQ